MKCEWCGKEFDGRNTRARFCCDECRHEMAKKYAREYKRRRLKQDAEFRKRHNDCSNEYGKRKRKERYAKVAHQIYNMVIEAQDREEVEAKITKLLMNINSKVKGKLVLEELFNEPKDNGKGETDANFIRVSEGNS